MGFSLFGVPEALSVPPPLTTVKIKLNDDKKTTIEGRLLDHSGGVWYCFNKENSFTRLLLFPTHRSIALKCFRVLRIRMIRRSRTLLWLPRRTMTCKDGLLTVTRRL